ncbi:hypothetical protein [Pseudomonas vranovensis]|uniref:hypothetical protein n=1 Tax=Pseudomonas vranovensis TaxID=321661 RepID=UPI000401457C|nr:hypothetical protein [Pseudomonas vranovensis]
MRLKKTTEEFIRDGVAVHGNRYDYSKVKYVSNRKKVVIICKKHGGFEQTPANHLYFGCKLCGFENAGKYHKKDTEKFIAAAKVVHGSKYDYSVTKYIGARNSLTIICSIHGEFEQTAGVHLSGAGCEPCSYSMRGKQARMTFEDFVDRAVKLHDGRYEYTLSKDYFQGTATKIQIVCPEHGIFEQLPSGHLQGGGCPLCAVIRTGNSMRKTTESFIEDARAVHGIAYDYSETDYKGAFDRVTIICPIDGAFNQSPTGHLGGTGCPKCSRRAQGAPRNLVRAFRGEFDQPRKAFVYMIRFRLLCSNTPIFKVGSGSGSRMKTVLGSINRIGGTEVEITSISFNTSGEAIVFEHIAHDQIRAHQFAVPIEFKFPGYSEVFSKAPDFSAVEKHFDLERFRSGERWDPRKR